MRTTLDIDAHLYQQAKEEAASKGKTLTYIVEEALRQYLSPKIPSKPFKLKVITTSGKLMHEVNIDDRRSLYDVMDPVS